MAETLSLALTGLSADNPIPGIYAEVRFAQGRPPIFAPSVLILAPGILGGQHHRRHADPADQRTENDAITYAGAGSPRTGWRASSSGTTRSARSGCAAPAATAATATGS